MAKSYSLLGGQQTIEMLQDPAFAEQYTQGFLKGKALAQTIEETPMQPEVTAEAIQQEPTFIQPVSTTYTGFKDEAPAQPSVFDEMQTAKSPKEQQQILFKLLGRSMEQQQAGVKQAEEALRKEQERQAGMGVLQKLDLRPFAEALRSYGATSVAQAQAPEMTEAQRQELLRKLQAQVQGAQEGMTKEQVAALRTMMQDKQNAQAMLSQGNQELRIRSMVNTSDQAKKIRNIGTLNTKLKNLEELVSSIGAEVTGSDKAKLESAFKDAEIAWKEAANLGALQGPDIKMIEGALGQSPTTGKGLFGYALSGGKEGLLNKIRGARERAITEGQGHLENVMTVFPYPVADPIFKDLSKKLELKPAEAGAGTKNKRPSFEEFQKMKKQKEVKK